MYRGLIVLQVIEKSHENEVEDEGYMKTGIRILNKRL